MSDESTTQVNDTDVTNAAPAGESVDFAERYKDILGKVNETLDKVDWGQAGRIGKVVGIFAAVIVAQILIKGILDTINLLPVVPGLLELLGVVVVGLWRWKNLTTGEKRCALVARSRTLRKA